MSPWTSRITEGDERGHSKRTTDPLLCIFSLQIHGMWRERGVQSSPNLIDWINEYVRIQHK